MRPTDVRIHLLSLSVALAAAGCGSSGSTDPDPQPTPAAEPTVEETLHALGVDTTETPRVDHEGDALPASYSPLGTTYELEKLSELLVLGVELEDATRPISVHDLEIDLEEPDAPTELLHAISSADAPWAEDTIQNDLPPVSRRAAAAADVDGIDEVALGGLWLPGEWCIGHYVMTALDDAAHGLEPLGSAVLSDEVGDEEGGSGCEERVYWAHVGIADLEGEHAGEIHVNELVFWDLKAQAPWTLRVEIPEWFTFGLQHSTTTSAMTVADFTGDARADIAVVADGRDEVAVWGIAPDDPDQELAKLRAVPLDEYEITVGHNPVLVPVNVNSEAHEVDLIDLDEALVELASLDERQARVVNLRYFAGLEVNEVAEVLGVSKTTIERDWRAARAWLWRRLKSA